VGKQRKEKETRGVQRGAEARERAAREKVRPVRQELPKWKFALFSLIPLLLLLLVAEVAARLVVTGRPEVSTVPLPEESAGLLEANHELFWSVIPNLDLNYLGGRVQTDSRGLRNGEIKEKAENEFRILSLGESTTFGVGVDNHDTYTAILESLLQTRHPDKTIRSINAGVSAYSSFQSLKYLQLKGVELKPDVVVFYHELNDYLPSTLRDSSQKEIGVMKTDKQLYASRTQWLSRNLMRWSALFRSLSYRVANRNIRALNRDQVENNPLQNVGLPNIGIPPRLRRAGDSQEFTSAISERSFGQRVSEKERLEVLEELVSTCKQHGIALVVVHPSYRHSRRHECLLTRFCFDQKVLMLEAYDALHPPHLDPQALYRDFWHPNREGHRRLAEALAEFIDAKVLGVTGA
jgi:lysophospholipase L1-like esterase